MHAQTPASIAGVMSRWQTSSKKACQRTYHGYAAGTDCPRSLMFTITPDLDGLSLRDWVNALASTGVNTAVIYVMPGYRIGVAPVVGQAEWVAYNSAIYQPPDSLTDAQKQTILEVGQAISQREYTVAQRNYAILVFLRQLQDAFPRSTPIRFVLDERAWFIDHLNADGEPVPMDLDDVFSLERAYAGDISGIVNLAARAKLDHWLTGVRLSEYAAKNWNLMGPVMVDLVSEINAGTAGWMKTHIFIGAGGGWGQYWNGVDRMQCPASAGWQFKPCTGGFPFFSYMAQQAGYFAFGDKFMEFGKPQQYLLGGEASGLTYVYINGEVLDFCTKNTRNYVCDDPAAPSVKDWEAFLGDDEDGLGFADLVDLMRGNARRYPRLANVIFEGDNSDSFATMTLPNSVNGAAALSEMFNNAMNGVFQNVEAHAHTPPTNLGTWTGKIFLDGFDDSSTVPRPGFYGDAGYSMFATDYKDFMFTPEKVHIFANANTISMWSNWPRWPGLASSAGD